MAEHRVPVLQVDDLHVFYGHSHALQGVTLTLDHGVLAVVGRNGMGKTTLCNAIMGLVQVSRGSVRAMGESITGLASNEIVDRGFGYVPQGRRVWPSLSVDEHLRLAARDKAGDWTVERIYETFPQLKERRRHGGAELSGGEQQMLAIGRALLANPRLLIMDEPTEGLAPVIVEQVAGMLHELANEGSINVLLVEQNLGVATDVSDRVAIMVNGRIARTMSAQELSADSELQHRLLGVRSGDEDEAADSGPKASPEEETVRIFSVRRQHATEADEAGALASEFSTPRGRTRWGTPAAISPEGPDGDGADRAAPQHDPGLAAPPAETESGELAPISVGQVVGRVAYVAGTFDTKGRELNFLRACIRGLGLRTVTVDLSTSRTPSSADVGPAEVARHHPKGIDAVFTGDRGTAVTAMAEAFECFIRTRRDVGGLISAGGSGGTALATPAMRALPIGIPKIMVSTVASGDVGRYVGPADICMIYSVTDVQGLNRISELVLSNAAHALAGMVGHRRTQPRDAKPAIGLTMFGVTTPCVQMVQNALEADYDCLTFHATGTGGQSMEKLVDSGMLAGVLDITTTEVCDHLMGGVFSAGEDRFGAIIRSKVPYVGSCGALDMVNFYARDTVPGRYQQRRFYQHNPNVTLMRTTAEENDQMGRWIGERLNRMEGPVRFLIPEGGVSLLDAEGAEFWDPEADRALFRAIEETLRPTAARRLVKLPHNINDPAFADALVQHFREVMAGAVGSSRPTGDNSRITQERRAHAVS